LEIFAVISKPKILGYGKSLRGKNNMTTLVLIGLIGATIYFLPWIVAHSRKHRQLNSIVVLNAFLGWTFIGWVAALVWALTSDVEPKNKMTIKSY
jgi:hypothetical protein